MSAGSRHYAEAERLLAGLGDIERMALAGNLSASTLVNAQLIVLGQAQVHATLAVADFTRDK